MLEFPWQLEEQHLWFEGLEFGCPGCHGLFGDVAHGVYVSVRLPLRKRRRGEIGDRLRVTLSRALCFGDDSSLTC